MAQSEPVAQTPHRPRSAPLTTTARQGAIDQAVLALRAGFTPREAARWLVAGGLTPVVAGRVTEQARLEWARRCRNQLAVELGADPFRAIYLAIAAAQPDTPRPVAA